MNSIRNFRSLGGIKTPMGTIKENTLLRGGPLSHIKEEDKDVLLGSYDLKTIIDFRNDHEVSNEPDKHIENTEYKRMRIMRENDELSANPSDIAAKATETKSNGFMFDIYRSFVSDEFAREGYHHFLKSLASQEEGATYFHCTAGKDRTGFAAALVLRILGADMDTIMKDYLETNTLILKNRDDLVKNVIKFHPFDTTNDELVMDVIGVREGYLHASFDEIHERYGSFDMYLEEGLKIDDETLEKLRLNLLK